MRSVLMSWATVLLVACAATPLPAAELTNWLGREIIGPALSMQQVQAYIEPRLPPVRGSTDPDLWTKQAEALRKAVLDRIVFRGEAARWRAAQSRVEWQETLDAGPGYHIRKLRYEALPGLWIPALLYEPDELEGRVPVMLNVNGHDRNGKAAPYKQIRCINQAKRGMIALNVEWLGMGQLATEGFKHYRMNQLDLCGTSGLAPYFLAMQRGLDVLLAHEHADPARVGVAGLSGGGWQTIFISSLDTRVTLANPVAGYSGFATRVHHLKDLGDSEQTPSDLATMVDYTHLTALMAPRPLLLTNNAMDNCCFEAGYAQEPLLEAARPFYRMYDAEPRLGWHINTDPGTHNFERDNREALYRFLGQHFFADDASFDSTEIASDDEILSADELNVELPADNSDFNQLALPLAAELPRDAMLPADVSESATWQNANRERLGTLIARRRYLVHPEETGRDYDGPLTVTRWKLHLDDDWTVPAVEFSRAESRGTVILVADEGRASLAGEVERWLDRGERVVAMDPFYLGESKIAERDFLFALLLAAIGDRPLGLQAGQLIAVAQWLQDAHTDGPVTLAAVGPRISLAALCASAIEQDAIAGLELTGSLGSLRQVVEESQSVDKAPELFCFGLLETDDILQIAATVAPRPVTFRNSDEALRKRLADLPGWYRTLGAEFRPFD